MGGEDAATDQVGRQEQRSGEESRWSRPVSCVHRRRPPCEAELQRLLLDLTQCDERWRGPDTLFWEKIAMASVACLPAMAQKPADGAVKRDLPRGRRPAVLSLPRRWQQWVNDNRSRFPAIAPFPLNPIGSLLGLALQGHPPLPEIRRHPYLSLDGHTQSLQDGHSSK